MLNKCKLSLVSLMYALSDGRQREAEEPKPGSPLLEMILGKSLNPSKP